MFCACARPLKPGGTAIAGAIHRGGASHDLEANASVRAASPRCAFGLRPARTRKRPCGRHGITRKGEGVGKPDFRVFPRPAKRASASGGAKKPEGLPSVGLRRTTKSWQGAKPDDGKPPQGGSSRHRLPWSRVSAKASCRPKIFATHDSFFRSPVHFGHSQDIGIEIGVAAKITQNNQK